MTKQTKKPESRKPAPAPAAKRALAEAQARREKQKRQAKSSKEIDGPEGLEPIRYGDWERKGIVSDF